MSAKPAAKLRNDPPPRAFDGNQDVLIELVNRDPAMHYCWVAQSRSSMVSGLANYRARGYRTVAYRKGGVCPRGMEQDLREGQPIEYLDTVLMECPLEAFEAANAYGQKIADKREGQMIDRTRGPRDPMRGIAGLIGRQRAEQTVSVRETSGDDNEAMDLFGG